MEEKRSVAKVVIPEGCCGAYYSCTECIWGEPNEKDSSGKMWCSKYRQYYKEHEAGGCDHFHRKS